MPWLTVLKYGLPILALIALGAFAYQRGYASAEAKYKAEIATMQSQWQAEVTAAREKADAQELDMHKERDARMALSIDLANRVDSYNGLSGELRNAYAAARASNVPPASGHPSPEGASPGGACEAGVLDAAVSEAIQACRSDSIALSVLGSKSVCECATP